MLRIMKKAIYVFLTVFIILCFFQKDRGCRLSPGVMAADDPVQAPIPFSRDFEFKGYKITPLAQFSIKAKVLSKKNYRCGRTAELSPVDLAL